MRNKQEHNKIIALKQELKDLAAQSGITSIAYYPLKNPPLVNISYHDDKPQQEAADDKETRAEIWGALSQHANVSSYVIEGILYTTEEDQLVLTYSTESFTELVGKKPLIIKHMKNPEWLTVLSQVTDGGYSVMSIMHKGEFCPMTDKARATFIGQWLEG